MVIKKRICVLVLMVLTFVALPYFAPKISGQEKKDRKPVHIQFRTAGFGGITYIMGFAWADLINKSHPWLRGSAMETLGSIENVKVTAENPAKRKYTIMLVTGVQAEVAWVGTKPYFDKAYPDLMAVANCTIYTQGICTYDSKIKKLQDLAGKRFAYSTFGSAHTLLLDTALKGAGVYDKIKIQRMTIEAGANALMDGLVDATISAGFPCAKFDLKKRTGEKFLPSPGISEMMSKGRLYVIEASEEEIKRGSEIAGAKSAWMIVPKDSYAPNLPDREMGALAFQNVWWAFPDMSDEMVYEAVKVMYDHHKRFVEYHPVGDCVTPRMMTYVPIPENRWHPGALKFYREKGIKIGIE